MSWEILHNAKVLQNTENGALGIQCGCGGPVIQVGNAWKDVTEDFEWSEVVVPLYYAVIAGNKVLQLTATMQPQEDFPEGTPAIVKLFETDKWHSIVDSTFPIMVVHGDGTVSMIDGQHFPDGYVEADVQGLTTNDMLYLNIFVPVE